MAPDSPRTSGQAVDDAYWYLYISPSKEGLKLRSRGGTGSLTFTGFVFAGIRGANQCVWARFDGVREFPEIFGDVAEIIEEFVDILGVDVEGLIQMRGQVGRVGKSAAKFGDGLANVGPIFADERIDMIDSFVSFRGSLLEILQERF
jgi:hypothetical protein